MNFEPYVSKCAWLGRKIGFLADLSPPSTSDSIEEAQINLKANIDFTSLLVKL